MLSPEEIAIEIQRVEDNALSAYRTDDQSTFNTCAQTLAQLREQYAVAYRARARAFSAAWKLKSADIKQNPERP